MTTVRKLLEDLPPDEREADAPEIAGLGIDLEAHIEDLDEAARAQLWQFLLRRRAEPRQKVAALKAKAQKRHRKGKAGEGTE